MGTEELGDRMKRYEEASLFKLPIRMPVIMRVDGKNFHSLLKDAEKPFDENFKQQMDYVGVKLVEEVQGAALAYLQSDEVSVLITPYLSLEYSPWYDNEIQKMSSIGASIATKAFNSFDIEESDIVVGKRGLFDCRVFVIPREDVVNYFIWRQRDWETNSVQMVARYFYSHKALENKSCSEMKEMIKKAGEDWDKFSGWEKRGRVITRVAGHTAWAVDDNLPRFEEKRVYVDNYVYPITNEG
jgi:tRNA(His) 5'-end guanylyltransferase